MKVIWRRYKGTHVLAKNYYKIKKRRSDQLLEFINSCRTTGTCVSIDSFYPAIGNVTIAYEYSCFIELFNNCEFIKSIDDIHLDCKFDNVIAVGQDLLRYTFYIDAVNAVNYLKQLLKKDGVLIICLPLKVMQFHRLKYNSTDLIEKLTSDCSVKLLGSTVDNINNYYLALSNDI